MVTGAAGNLGQKLIARLDAEAWCGEIIMIDRLAAPGPAKARAVVADLSDAGDSRWIEAVAATDAIVHLAADNPYPDASWEEAARSLDMTANLAARAANRRCRFVFASSNHVMGGYKEEELPAGTLTTALPPRPGTRFYLPESGYRADAGYAVAKLMGERVLAAAAAASAGRLTGVSLRIGWCQPGANLPATLTGDGLRPGDARVSTHEGHKRDLRWFRSMWLSNADFGRAVIAALRADATRWPAASVVVNAMSGNRDMPWDVSASATLIGYVPQDNVWDHL
jgi:nucleoside-diphosphate-sugar epimerase